MEYNALIDPRISYSTRANIAIISMDDGKANAISGPWCVEMSHCLDRAEQDGIGAVILIGRAGIFSAGLDIHVFPQLDEAEMMR